MPRDHRVRRAVRTYGLVGVACLLFIFLFAASPIPAKLTATELCGTWAELKVLSDSVTFPVVGDLERTTTLLQRVTISQSKTTLKTSATYCTATFDNGPSLTTAINETFMRSLDAVVAQANVDESEDPMCFVQSWTVELHGVDLDNPELDSLPTDANDPRIFDQDGDGKPGITVKARALGFISGDVYMIERLRIRLDGEVVSPDRIEGQIEGTVEQVIIGATNRFFLGPIQSRPDPVSTHSFFILKRIDPAWTCEDILAHREELFGQ